MERNQKAPAEWETVYRKIRQDIFALCRLLNLEPTHQQAELFRAVQAREPRIAVKSGQGTGKCVSPYTEVLCTSTGERVTLLDLVKRGSGFSVPSMLEGSRKIVPAPATAMLSGRKPCVRVTSASGQWVDASTDHPMLTQRGWVHAGELKEGDLLAMPRFLPAPENVQQVPDYVVRLAAYFGSDGCTAGSQARFTQMPGLVMEEFKADVLLHGGRFTEARSKSKANDVRTVGLMPLIRYFGYDKCLSKNKRTPSWSYGLPNSQIALFLNRFWACDGWIDKNGPSTCLASEGMIRDIQTLLLRLGIHSTYRYRVAKCEGREFDAWTLNISGQSNVWRFYHTVGPILGKEDACTKQMMSMMDKKENTNTDVVPITDVEMSEILEEMGVKNQRGRWGTKGLTKKRARELCRGRNYSYISRTKFQTFCREFKYTGNYAWLASSDVYWVKFEKNEDLGVQEVADLSVPPHGNFVAQNIVVHNTTASALCAIWRVIQAPHSRVIVTAPSMRQAQDVYMTEVRRLVSNGPAFFQRLFYPTIRKVYVGRAGKDDDSRPDWGIMAVTATDPRNAQGYHGDNISFFVDESSGVGRGIIEQIEGTLSQNTGDFLHLHTGNPNTQDCAFFDFFNKKRKYWRCLTFDALSSPRVSPAHCAYMKDVYGERSDVYRVRVLGEFPTMDPNAVMSVDDIEACVRNDPLECVRASKVKQFGIDLARYGSDESVIAQRSGNALVGFEHFAKVDPNEVVRKAFVMQSESGWDSEETVYVADADGMGQGVMDTFYRAEKNLHEFRTSARPRKIDFHDKMSEAWFCLGRLVKARAVYLPEDRDLIQQLSSRIYDVTDKGKIRIESKQKYKDRTEQPSPDRADAAVMAFYDGAESAAVFSFGSRK